MICEILFISMIATPVGTSFSYHKFETIHKNTNSSHPIAQTLCENDVGLEKIRYYEKVHNEALKHEFNIDASHKITIRIR